MLIPPGLFQLPGCRIHTRASSALDLRVTLLVPAPFPSRRDRATQREWRIGGIAVCPRSEFRLDLACLEPAAMNNVPFHRVWILRISDQSQTSLCPATGYIEESSRTVDTAIGPCRLVLQVRF